MLLHVVQGDRQRHRRARRQVRDGRGLRQPGLREADHRQLGRLASCPTTRSASSSTWARRGMKHICRTGFAGRARRARTIRSPTASTRSTRWSSSTTSRSRGRTSSSTATPARRTYIRATLHRYSAFAFVQRNLRLADMMIGAALYNVRQTGLEKQQAVQEKLAQLACYREGINAHLTAAIALAEESPGGLLMPNQSLLYTGRVLACSQLPRDDAHRPRAVRRPDLRHARRRHLRRPRDRRRGWRSSTPINENWAAEDRRKLLAFARDLLNSDYAGHRLTFQLFAQSPPFAHLAAVYRNFDWDGPARVMVQGAPPGCPSSVLDVEGSIAHADATAASARSTPGTPTPSRSSTTTSARRWSPATRSTCAGRSRRTWTRARRRRSATPRRQAEQAMDNIELLLDECGATLEDIVQVHDLPDRHPLPRAGLPRARRAAARRASRSSPASSSSRWRGPSGSSRSTSTAVLAMTFSLAARCRTTGASASSSRPRARPSPRAARTRAPASARPPPRTSPTRRSGRRCSTCSRAGCRRREAMAQLVARRRTPSSASSRASTLTAAWRRYSGERTLGTPRRGRGRRLRRGRQPARRRGRARGDGRRVRGRGGDDLGDRLVDALDRRRSPRAARRAGALGRAADRRRRAPGRSPICASTGTASRSTSCAGLWTVWKPQLDDYVARALDPDAGAELRRAGGRVAGR